MEPAAIILLSYSVLESIRLALPAHTSMIASVTDIAIGASGTSTAVQRPGSAYALLPFTTGSSTGCLKNTSLSCSGNHHGLTMRRYMFKQYALLLMTMSI